MNQTMSNFNDSKSFNFKDKYVIFSKRVHKEICL